MEEEGRPTFSAEIQNNSELNIEKKELIVRAHREYETTQVTDRRDKINKRDERHDKTRNKDKRRDTPDTALRLKPSRIGRHLKWKWQACLEGE